MKVITLFLIFLLVAPQEAESRSRFGRSFGKRGTRSFFNNTKRTNTFKRKAAPRQNTRSNKINSMNSPRRSGGFMKSMMGAVAGTMIGGMLFRALGLNTGAMGAGGGGMGLFFPLMLILGAFLYFRYRKQPQYASNNYTQGGYNQTAYNQNEYVETESTEVEQEHDQAESNDLAIASTQEFIADRNKDFFSIQHAWSKKDLTSVKGKMTSEIYNEFTNEIEEMKQKGHSSTLENLMINNSTPVASWNENNSKFITYKFDVSLIEYESDANGNIVSGKKDDYTDISEFWTFTQDGYGNDWKVTAVENPNT
jgi:predicted lipid-binding transport protein (Tim44 family)